MCLVPGCCGSEYMQVCAAVAAGAVQMLIAAGHCTALHCTAEFRVGVWGLGTCISSAAHAMNTTALGIRHHLARLCTTSHHKRKHDNISF